MDAERRRVLKTGAAALGGLLAAESKAAMQAASAPFAAGSVPQLSGKAGVRLACFATNADPKPRLGLVQDDGRIVDVADAAARCGQVLVFDASSMLALIASGDRGLAQVLALQHAAAPAATYALQEVRLLSPIPEPRANIYCVGWNYLDHFEEGQAARMDNKTKEYPQVPVFFSKATQTMNGPFDPIPYDAELSTLIDWEAELAVVIGKGGRNIRAAEAMSHVFGYAAYNDTTARDIQQKRHSGQWFKGKSLDGHGPMGPWLVTAGGLSLDDTRVICRVNGVEKQNASYKQMYFKIPAIIAELSRGLTLLPGDIIATGTPSGVGFGRKPPEFLKPGDVMETEITGVGVLRNVIGA